MMLWWFWSCALMERWAGVLGSYASQTDINSITPSTVIFSPILKHSYFVEWKKGIKDLSPSCFLVCHLYSLIEGQSIYCFDCYFLCTKSDQFFSISPLFEIKVYIFFKSNFLTWSFIAFCFFTVFQTFFRLWEKFLFYENHRNFWLWELIFLQF